MEDINLLIVKLAVAVAAMLLLESVQQFMQLPVAVAAAVLTLLLIMAAVVVLQQEDPEPLEVIHRLPEVVVYLPEVLLVLEVAEVRQLQPALIYKEVMEQGSFQPVVMQAAAAAAVIMAVAVPVVTAAAAVAGHHILRLRFQCSLLYQIWLVQLIHWKVQQQHRVLLHQVLVMVIMLQPAETDTLLYLGLQLLSQLLHKLPVSLQEVHTP